MRATEFEVLRQSGCKKKDKFK